MLLERATGLAAKITRYRDLRGIADQAEQFQTRADQFGNVSERLTATHDALRRFKEAGIEVSFAMTETWKRYVDERSDLHSDDVLIALPQFKPSVTKILQCRANVAALGASLPPEPATAVAGLSALVDEHRTAWAELTADGIPDAVIAFLRACAAEGAPLSGLTDEVRSWLESRNLLSAFRIKIR